MFGNHRTTVTVLVLVVQLASLAGCAKPPESTAAPAAAAPPAAEPLSEQAFEDGQLPATAGTESAPEEAVTPNMDN
jgi:hypothetical protein